MGDSASVRGLSCGGGTTMVEVDKHLARNLSVPSFTWGFFVPRAGRISDRISGRVVW